MLLAAFVPRLGLVLHSGGLGGVYGYDAGVYYTAADAIAHGRLPYRDFVLVHPPGIALALTPFAALGQVIGDHAGFMTATVAWMLLGSVNAVLVVRVAERMGLDRRASVVGGLCYALWMGSVNSEFLIRLEPLGNFFMLAGLLAYFTASRTGGRTAAMLCGMGFGAAACVKIWWVVPLVVMLAWHLCSTRRARLSAVVVGAAVTLLAIDGPFFLAAPRQMWSMIVLDQLGRARAGTLGLRLSSMSGLNAFALGLSRSATLAVLASIALVFLIIAVLAARTPAGRLVVTLLLAQLVVLIAGPPWFAFYADYAAPGLALSIAAAIGYRLRAARKSETRHSVAMLATITATVAAVAVTLLVGAADILRTRPAVAPFPSQALASTLLGARCVASDSPMALIELNVLSSDLSRGCANWVDILGKSYEDARSWHGAPGGRTNDLIWQRDLRRYLLSGDTLVLYHSHIFGFGAPLHHLLHQQDQLARLGGVAVLDTDPLPPAAPVASGSRRPRSALR